MKGSDIIQALERFFLDLIGQVVPGVAFLVLLQNVWGVNWRGWLSLQDSAAERWVFLIAAGYVVGHGLAPLADWYQRTLGWVADGIRSMPFVGGLVPDYIQGDPNTLKATADSGAFRAFVIRAKEVFPWTASMDAGSVKAWRSVAMTVSEEHDPKVYRFMFISLLTRGIGAVLVLFLFVGWIVTVIDHGVEAEILPREVSGGAAFFGLAGSLIFMARSYEFYARSMRVPFVMALPKLVGQAPDAAGTDSGRPAIAGGSVYLAGGFRSGWQDVVKSAIPKLSFADPREHGLSDARSYAAWDLEAIRQSRWVLAYLELGNPGGYAMALEIGYAHALGKRIIIVDEKSQDDETMAGLLAMLHACANVSFDTLTEAISFMKHIEALDRRASTHSPG